MTPEELARLQAAMAGQPGALDAMRAANQGALQQGPYRGNLGVPNPDVMMRTLPYHGELNGVPVEQYLQQSPARAMTLQERQAILDSSRTMRPQPSAMSPQDALARALRGIR